jgi:dTDP-glucose 4,6-dehydratase
MRKYLVTGGAGFIGSCFVLASVKNGYKVLNLDKLGYSGNLMNLEELSGNPDHTFVQGDIGDADLPRRLLRAFQPDAVINFAAESHVDRSILDPESFARANVLGACSLLGAVLEWWKELPIPAAENFRFLHISTDEVYGSLGAHDPAFTENTPYAPNSPYSASKAAGDHFVRAFHETYKLPTIITNCSNNYGPRQFPEKLIPLSILRLLAGEHVPVYGAGENIRDWLHVEDHCAALELALQQGTPGQTYNIGGNAERRNIDLARALCLLLDELRPSPAGAHARLIRFVTDRAGHDFRYAVNAGKIESELGWKRAHSFESGLRETVNWYLDHPHWLEAAQSGAYQEWTRRQYLNR